MRYITFLLFVIAFPAGGAEIAIGPAMVRMPGAAEMIEKVVEEEAAPHLIVLGALEKVNHELQPEKSEIINGFKSAFTYYLPRARRTGDVGRFYRDQLVALGEVVFECEGRTCGSSSSWANSILDRAIIYGPEQHQRYYVAKTASGYLSIYVGQRATRKIYVHIEYIETAGDIVG